MKKYMILTVILMTVVTNMLYAQKDLRFGDDKSFRIAQFTDMHLDPGTPYRRAQAEKTLRV